MDRRSVCKDIGANIHPASGGVRPYKILWGLLVIIVAQRAIGSETRVNTLGGVPWFLIDNSNVRLYPGLVTNYPNEIIGEIKRQAAYCFIEVGRLGIFGLGINADTVPTIVNRAIEKAGAWRFNSPSPVVTIYYGREIIGRVVALGVKLGESNKYYEEGEQLQEINFQECAIGAKILVRQDSYIDLTGEVARFGFESIRAYPELVRSKEQGRLSFNGRARLLSQISPTALFIIGANYDNVDVSWSKGKEMSEELTSQTVEGYAGFNFTTDYNTTLSPKATIILGVLVGQTKGDTSFADTSWINTSWKLPELVMGIETFVTDWLLVRLGGSRTFLDMEGKKVSGDIEIDRQRLKEEKFNLSLGWCLAIGEFELDVMANDLPFVTPSISLSATYRFAELF